ncbi:PP2C family protein-serine/threonine phosphatase [Dorea sp.]
MAKYNIELSAAGETRKGSACTINEDNFQVGNYYKKKYSKDHDAYVIERLDGCRYMITSVYDGIGGGGVGKVASSYAAEDTYLMQKKLEDKLSGKEVSCVMQYFFQSVNNRIVRNQEKITGTTGVICVVDRKKRKARFYWSGDSRGYLYRNQCLFQITKDQNVEERIKEQSYWMRKDFRYMEQAKYLTGFIGNDLCGYEFEPLKSSWISLRDDDRILLLTDGISEVCSERELEKEIQKSKSNIDCCEKIIKMARAYGSEDDMTIVSVRIQS